MKRRGLMFVVSSPSGAGKTTLTRNLVNADRNLDLSISVTTRPKRASEIHGQHYHFISKKEFARMRRAGELLEFAKVHGNYYGTPRKPVEKALAASRDVLFDIDWQGTQQLEYAFRTDLVLIFILPPSMKELERRLHERGTDSEEIIAGRMRRAAGEIGHWAEYDYVLINEDMDKCLADVRAIIAAERLRRQRQPYLLNFVRELVARPN